MTQIRWSPLLVLPPGSQSFLAPPDLPGARSSGTVVLSGTPTDPAVHPVTAVLSSLHRSDLLLLSKAGPSIQPLPVSLYPAKPGTIVRAHFFSDVRPQGEDGEGWVPWIGGSWVKWVRGTVLGYRDFAGREAQVRPEPFISVCIARASHNHSNNLARNVRQPLTHALQAPTYSGIERRTYC